jgi:Zn-finger nucleic acid-binding protein
MKSRKLEDKLSLELKYCERCGGLWLRPAGGAQIYCMACAQQMAQLPAASHELEGSSGERCALVGEIDDIDEFQDVEMARNAGGRL